MSESEKHVTITERRFDAVHFTRGEVVVRERLLVGAICLIQACAVISCDRDFTAPVRIEGQSFIPRVDPLFSRYTIEATATGAIISWDTDLPLSTGWAWGVPLPGHGGETALPPIAPLESRHYAAIDYEFEIDIAYEFQASGLDADGVIHKGATLHFQRYVGGEEYRFTETSF